MLPSVVSQWRWRWRRRTPETIRPDIGMLMIIWWREEKENEREEQELGRKGERAKEPKIAVELVPGEPHLAAPAVGRHEGLIDFKENAD